jgi:ribosomal protein S18 acetylase RimI-like enzyme
MLRPVQIRDVEPDEYERLGAITLEAYVGLDGHIPEPEYEAELADVGTRATTAGAAVLVALDDEGRPLGGVTYVGDPRSALAEQIPPDGAGIRMLAVDRAAQGQGIGEALTRACIERARAEGKRQLVLHSTTWMHTAHRLYSRLGFERDESLDWTPGPGVDLLGFRLPLA